MKKISVFFVLLFFTTLLTGCLQNTTIPLEAESMKGYELYSWQNGDEWNFSLLIGTNREKTIEEIKNADSTLKSINELDTTLEQLAPGQYITWSTKDSLAFPPADLIEQVQQICAEQDLVLNIAK
jgi:hypothetical protein